ncbi:hypothetical protein SAMN04488074_119116 [Lentzea albidocapillata subsp. violacea]|uniref:CopC domain-containing protein n=1 Tax=Lentzea albidocapillata subsp. violacea TaxID=128104 RepID=A0A1G9S4J1_9PSEU|nr:copper resistance CopC family protein [Lentzea albidocapillata]SDM30227.1 hypothetical protein SAMN04488074_119116 [Lentzea albidocapillata subsp. violacea]
MKRLVVTLVLAVAAVFAGSSSALAHNVLVRSDPADGAAMASGPSKVMLTFDQPMQQGFNTVTVRGPDGTRWDSGEPSVSGNEVTAGVLPLGPAGDYVVGYRVLSADGHPVAGKITMRLTQTGTGTPASPSAPQLTDTASTGGVGDAPVWPWIAGAVVLLASGVVLALRTGKKPR